MSKKIANYVIIILSIILIGFILLLAVNLIPTDKLNDNVRDEVSNMYSNEGIIYYPSKHKEGGRVDNFSDSIILFLCVKDRTTTLVTHCVEASVVKEAPLTELYDYLKDGNADADEYSRYWHGYQVILKPLLSVISYGNVRLLNFIIQILLVAVISILAIKKGLWVYALAYIITYLNMAPKTMGLCMHFSPMYYVSSISIILALLYTDKIHKYATYYFMIIGMVVCYLDLISYPLITLGFPLVFLFSSYNDEKYHIKEFITNCLFWCIGYASMWLGKWIIASVVLKDNFIAKCLNVVEYRMGSKNGMYDIFFDDPFLDCFSELPIIYYIFGACIIFILISIVERRFKLVKKHLILIGLLPFLWAMVIKNHTYVHSWYTYRIFGIFVICVICFITYNIKNYIIQERLDKDNKISE